MLVEEREEQWEPVRRSISARGGPSAEATSAHKLRHEDISSNHLSRSPPSRTFTFCRCHRAFGMCCLDVGGDRPRVRICATSVVVRLSLCSAWAVALSSALSSAGNGDTKVSVSRWKHRGDRHARLSSAHCRRSGHRPSYPDASVHFAVLEAPSTGQQISKSIGVFVMTPSPHPTRRPLPSTVSAYT